jgi:hypothetical protein
VKLRTVLYKDDGIHKALILDDNRSKSEGKLVAWVTANTEDEARSEAKDVSEAILRNGKAMFWN